MKIVVTFGTFDLFHIGHLNLLKNASKLGDKLIVGVSSDTLNFNKKNKKAIFSEHERLEIISSIKYVDSVFIEETLEQKIEYLKKCKANVLVMGDDWLNKFDYCKKEIPDLEVIYLPRTKDISTSEIIALIDRS